jgi:hypothetical protein
VGRAHVRGVGYFGSSVQGARYFLCTYVSDVPSVLILKIFRFKTFKFEKLNFKNYSKSEVVQIGKLFKLEK